MDNYRLHLKSTFQTLLAKIFLFHIIITGNHLKIHTIVHRTDTVTVSVACSFAPVVTDTDGLIRLSNALTRVEERTSRIVDECGQSLEGGYESIPIPEHSKWMLPYGILVLILIITES